MNITHSVSNPFKKCFSCGKSKNTRKTTRFYGHGFISYSYHDNCLKSILCNPEEFPHDKVYIAVIISDKIIDKARQQDKTIERAKSNCEKMMEGG